MDEIKKQSYYEKNKEKILLRAKARYSNKKKGIVNHHVSAIKLILAIELGELKTNIKNGIQDNIPDEELNNYVFSYMDCLAALHKK